MRLDIDLLDYEQKEYDYLIERLNQYDLNFDEKEDFIYHLDRLIDMLFDEIISRHL